MKYLDKDKIAEHKEEATVVFDDSLKGKNVDTLDKPGGTNFKDQGRITIPSGAKNLLVGDHKYTTPKFSKGYDEIEWMCDDCGKMHRKDVDCG
jgi:hypothetical protein